MKMTKYLLVFSVLAAAAGCKDKTVEEYQKEKYQQNLSRYSVVNGTYRGLVVSRATGKVVGAMELSLRADTKVNPSNDGQGSTPTPILVGNVRFLSQSVENLSAPNGYFDPDTGSYHADATVARSSGGTVTINLSGVIAGAIVDGQIQAMDYPERAGTFHLVKDSASIDDQLRNVSPGDRAEFDYSQMQTYIGSGYFGPGDFRKDFKLQAAYTLQSRTDDFIEIFSPDRDRNLNLSLVFAPGISGSFVNTPWNEQSGVLDGVSANGGYTAQVHCEGFFFRRTTRAFKCTYWTNRSSPIEITFKPAASR